MMTAAAATPGVVEANCALGRRFFQEQDRLRGGPAESLCAPEYLARIGANPEMPRAGHEGFAKAFYAAFPDMYHDIEEVFATEDRVFVRFVVHGTNTGSFFGMPATGKRVSVPAHVILFVAEGKVTRLVAVFDEAGLLRTLGILPAN
jgi:steroid delta-isomerase-like uncharacterized protein